jgi:hypothetical protein
MRQPCTAVASGRVPGAGLERQQAHAAGTAVRNWLVIYRKPSRPSTRFSTSEIIRTFVGDLIALTRKPL